MALTASIELSTRFIASRSEAFGLIPPATQVYIVDVGRSTAAEWADSCARLVESGLEPVPHIACRRVPSRAAIDRRLNAMSQAATIRNVLVVGGDADPPLGPFSCSLDFLAEGLLDRYGIRRVAVAGHPEGSPDIAPQAVVDALYRKAEFARQADIDLRIVTQFGFDPSAAIRWSERLLGQGIDLPIHVGIAGPTGVARLLRFAAHCGVRASMSYALKRGFALASLMGRYTPEPYARAIEDSVRAGGRTRIEQIHIFPFGDVADTARWLIGRGSWPKPGVGYLDGHRRGPNDRSDT
jgi:methylenetetrahydrofolate reductase (NADPH)